MHGPDNIFSLRGHESGEEAIPIPPHGSFAELQPLFWPTVNGATTKCKIPGKYAGYHGVAHGGVVATLLDQVGGAAVISQALRLGMTQEFTIRYHHPVPAGAEITLSGEVTSLGEHTASVRAQITSSSGQVLAEGESSWALPAPEAMAQALGVDPAIMSSLLRRLLDPVAEYMASRQGA